MVFTRLPNRIKLQQKGEQILKKILIINGYGKSGKGTFVKTLKQYAPTAYASIVDIPKYFASELGWKNTKTEKDRKFLCDLKNLIDNYSDSCYEYCEYVIEQFKNSGSIFLCIDMREKKDIERISKDYDVVKVLVKRDVEIPDNDADKNVENGIAYDYIIDNNGTIEDLDAEVRKFLSDLLKKEIKQQKENPKPKKKPDCRAELCFILKFLKEITGEPEDDDKDNIRTLFNLLNF